MHISKLTIGLGDEEGCSTLTNQSAIQCQLDCQPASPTPTPFTESFRAARRKVMPPDISLVIACLPFSCYVTKRLFDRCECHQGAWLVMIPNSSRSQPISMWQASSHWHTAQFSRVVAGQVVQVDDLPEILHKLHRHYSTVSKTRKENFFSSSNNC